MISRRRIVPIVDRAQYVAGASPEMGTAQAAIHLVESAVSAHVIHVGLPLRTGAGAPGTPAVEEPSGSSVVKLRRAGGVNNA